MLRALRIAYIRTTNVTHGYQGDFNKLLSFYRLWSKIYDLSVRIDPAYVRQLKRMIDLTVRPGENILDIGCGTGLGINYASAIAGTVTGVDISRDMIARLKKKIIRKNIKNVTLINGPYPESVDHVYDTVISSFAIVHFSKDRRPYIYKKIFENLVPGGKIGLFSAQGEIAPAFETKDEIYENLKANHFKNIMIQDVSDIYRIVTAQK
jgi:cyclopropane fatty-acyl-phospholipid synthase-like methyltransferase